ncbi:MAG: addiction module toxin, Txe/YoeB family [Rickettsiaceae bacterium]|jgi:Txe/YoeB family toxin of toxin-antitoxin system|nr:addiction module toxin, Txe/YoeB family [Rickettsiaceae bacterium]
MVEYKVYFTKQALKDAKKFKNNSLRSKIEKLLKLIADNPFCDIPPYEKLMGDLKGAYSRRINIQHRLVYQVIEEEKAVRVLRMWTHCE